ncbi:MAG: DUF2341 domain-containing protein [Candidatus Dojkabacteria bacterium]
MSKARSKLRTYPLRHWRWLWSTKVPVIFLVLMFLIGAVFGHLITPRKAKAEWYNDLWAYRKQIDISGNASDLTDIQFQVTGIDTSALYSVGKLQVDCQDIRFTDVQGNLLPYWVEDDGIDCSDDTTTDFWVRLQRAESEGTTIFMYYGNPDAGAGGSGDKTFEFFDDFSESIVDWYSSLWSFRIRLSVQKSKVDAALTDFPVFVDLSDLPGHFFSNADSGGNDLVVTSSDGTKLDRELVSIDTTARTGELWFRGDLNATTDTDFFIYYGNGSASETNATGTWTSAYAVVQHLNEDPSGGAPQMQDSTSNNNDGTSNGTMATSDLVNAVVGDGLQFDGSNDYISLSGVNATNKLTVSGWFYLEEYGGACDGGITRANASNPYGGFLLSPCSNGTPAIFNFAVANSTTWQEVLSSTDKLTGRWYYVVGVYDASVSSMKIYFDGVQDNSASATGNVRDNSEALRIGLNQTSYMKGTIDEVRVTSDAKSANWIAAEYSNQIDPGNFYHLGEPETETSRVLRPRQWTDTGSPAYTSGAVSFSYALGQEGILSTSQFSSDSKLVFRSTESATSLDDGRVGLSNTALTTSYNTDDAASYLFDSSTGANFEREAVNEGIATSSAGSTIEDTSAHDFEIGWTATTVDYRIDNATDGSIVTNLPDESMNIRIEVNNTSESLSVDWVAVASYNSDPPDTQNVGTEEIGPGPLVYLKLDEGQGQTASNSGSGGSQLDGYLGVDSFGTSNDPSWTDECISGGCLKFDGVDDAFEIPDNDLIDFGTDDFSVSMWMNFGDQAGGTHNYSIAFMKSDKTSSPYAGMTAFVDTPYSSPNGGVQFRLDSNNEAESTTTGMDDSRWRHYVFVRSGTTLEIYIDGILNKSQSVSSIDISDTANLRFGANQPVVTDQNFQGMMDEIKVYDYAIDQEKVLAELNTYADVLGTDTNGLRDGLVGWWKMDEVSANTCSGGNNDSCDSSGSGNDAAWANNVAATAGILGSGTVFDGTDDYIRDSSPVGMPTGASPRTVSAWVKLNALGTKQVIFQYGPPSITRNTLLMDISTANKPEFTSWADGATSTTSLTTGIWYHLVGTYDGDLTMKIYIDGDLDTTHTLGGQLISTVDGTGVNMGAWQAGVLDDLNGSLDEVRVYNKELSAAEIAKLYEYRPGPVARWKFDEKSGTTAYDSSISANNGTLTGMDGATDWVQGRTGGALDFDGINDYVSVADDDDLDFIAGASFSIAAWFKTTGAVAATQQLVGKGGLGNSIGYSLYLDATGNVVCGIDDDAVTFPEDSVTSSADQDDSAWHHVACVKDAGSSIRLYVDGVETGTADTTISATGTLASADAAVIGGQSGANYFSGRVDDVRMYDYDLTTSEVFNLYSSSTSSSKNPYKKVISLSPSTPSANYQVRVPLTSAEIDYTKTQDAGEDIRFEDLGGSPLDFWIESWDESGTSVVWVEAAASGTSSIVMTYGNTALSSASNGTNTFLYFTDLTSDPGLTGTNSTNSYAYYDGTNDRIYFQFRRDSSSNVDRYWTLPSAITEDSIATDYSVQRYYYISHGKYGDKFGSVGLSTGTADPRTSMIGSGYTMDTDYGVSVPTFVGRVANSSSYSDIGPWTASNTTVYQMSTGLDGTYASKTVYQNGTQVNTGNITVSGQTASYTEFNIYRQNYGHSQDYATHRWYLDDIRVRKFDQNEPVATVGEEEANAVALKVNTEREASGPLLKLNLDEKSGTTATDSSGNGNNGTLNGFMTDSDWVHGKVGNALDFDGVDDFVEVANESYFDQTTTLTVAGWVYLSDSSRSSFASKGTGASADGGWSWDYGGFNAGQVEFGVNGGSLIYMTVGAAMSINEWHYVVGVFDSSLSGNSRLSLYIDGVKQTGTYTNSGTFTTITPNNNSVMVGSKDGAIRFTGKIDKVRVWDRALTAREAAIEYNGGKPVGWWKMDRGEGNTAYDYSGNGNNGTLTNMAPASDWLGSQSCKLNSCLDFDGSDDYIVGNHSSSLNFNPNNQYTIEAWVYPRSTANNPAIYRKGGSGGSEVIILDIIAGKWRLVSRNTGGTAYRATGNAAVTANQWSHLIGVMDGSMLYLYVNGKLTDTAAFAGSLGTSTVGWAIGNRPDTFSATQQLDGIVDELKVYNYAFSKEDRDRSYISQGAALRFE